jgi:hypothetical protein
MKMLTDQTGSRLVPQHSPLTLFNIMTLNITPFRIKEESGALYEFCNKGLVIKNEIPKDPNPQVPT